jgi:hypothetical protein
MAAKIPIPEGIRWQIASKIASTIPVLYGQFFKEAMGSAYDRIEQQIWISLAQEAKKIAHMYDLPIKNSGELAATLAIITTVFFGPELKSEEVVFDGDRAVLMIQRCPFHIREQELRPVHGEVFNRCLAFSIAAVDALNPDYALRFVRSSCQGDRHCEMKIARKDMVEKEEEKKEKRQG